MERLDNKLDDKKYIQAQKRVKELKDYYWHLAIYFIINTIITIQKITRNLENGETFNEAFFDFATLAVWLFWGIGILFHTLKVFGSGAFFGREWEERKIKEFMESDKNRQSKY